MGRTAAITREVRAQEVARRVLWGQAHSEIMAELGLTYQQLHSLVSSPAFKEELRALQQKTFQELDERFRGEMETVQSRARGESLTAIDTLIAMMKSSASESLKRDCARDIIGYSGQDDATRRPVIQINHATFQLLNQAREEDDARGRVVNIDTKS
jgi:hypothetical protein